MSEYIYMALAGVLASLYGIVGVCGGHEVWRCVSVGFIGLIMIVTALSLYYIEVYRKGV